MLQNFDFANAKIYVNGNKVDENYILKEDDKCYIRILPSGSGFWSGVDWFLGKAWNAIYWGSGLRWIDHNLFNGAIDWTIDKISNLFSPESINPVEEYIKNQQNKKSYDSESTQNIPTIQGGKNRSASNNPIPLVIGKSLFTPFVIGNGYTVIDPTDGSLGENQYYKCLYLLGYNDIEVEDFKLGIYSLATNKGSNKVSNGSITMDGDGGLTYVTNDYKKNLRFSREFPPLGSNTNRHQKIVITADGKITSENLEVTVDYEHAWVESVNVDELNGKITIDVGCDLHLSDDILHFDWWRDVKLTVHYQGLKMYGFPVGVHYPYNKYYPKLEIQQGANEVSLYDQKVTQENFSATLTHPQGADSLKVYPFSKTYPQKVELEIKLNSLLAHNSKGNRIETSVKIAVGYSTNGGASYAPFDAFFATVPNNVNLRFSHEIALVDTTNPNKGTCMVTTITGCVNKVMRFIANHSFNYDDAMSMTNNAVEFIVFRYNEESTDSNVQNSVGLSAVRTWHFDYKKSVEHYEETGEKVLYPQRPMVEKYRNQTARLGFSIKADDGVNNTIDELNCIVKSKAKTCTVGEDANGKTYTWSNTTSFTNNPAALALMILEHPSRCEYQYDSSMIDYDSFGKFYEYCEERDIRLDTDEARKYVANGVISKQFKTLDLISKILMTGHGRLVLNNSKYAVWIDKAQSTPVMMINEQNLLDFSANKNFDEDIDGYQVTFIDERNYYQQDTLICVDEHAKQTKSPSEYKLENLECPWTTDSKRVYRWAMRKLAERRLRPETWTAKVCEEGGLCDYGDMVSLQTGVITVGIGSGAEIVDYITEGDYITGVKVDTNFMIDDTSLEYGIKIMQADGVRPIKVVTRKLVVSSTEFNELIFDEAIASNSTDKPNIGDIVSFGLYEKITDNALVFGKKDSGDGTYQLTLVPYQEGIYTAEDGSIPDFASNVTPPSQTGVTSDEELPVPDIDEVFAISSSVAREEVSALTTIVQGLSNSARVQIYKASTTALAANDKPTDNAVYNFTDGSFEWDSQASTSNGWSYTIPQNYQGDLYTSFAGAYSQESSVEIDATDWSSPVKFVKQGNDGTSGYNSIQINLYKRSSSSPSAPSGSLTYDFTAGDFSSGDLEGWSINVPTHSTGDLYAITTVIYTLDTTYSIASSEWSNPQVFARDGVDGVGVSSVTVTYASSSSGTVIPQSWQSTIPSVPQGEYLWTRTVTVLSNNQESTSYTVTRQGEDGSSGDRAARYLGRSSTVGEGVTDTNPSDLGTTIVGDWFLNENDGYVYVKSTETPLWSALICTSGTPDFRIMSAIDDLIELKGTSSATAVQNNTTLQYIVNHYFDCFFAGTAFIDKLFANYITIHKKTELLLEIGVFYDAGTYGYSPSGKLYKSKIRTALGTWRDLDDTDKWELIYNDGVFNDDKFSYITDNDFDEVGYLSNISAITGFQIKTYPTLINNLKTWYSYMSIYEQRCIRNVVNEIIGRTLELQTASLKWVEGDTYYIGDIVVYDWYQYKCIKQHNASSSILPTNTTYWKKLGITYDCERLKMASNFIALRQDWQSDEAAGDLVIRLITNTAATIATPRACIETNDGLYVKDKSVSSSNIYKVITSNDIWIE